MNKTNSTKINKIPIHFSRALNSTLMVASALLMLIAALILPGCAKQEVRTTAFETDAPYVELGSLRLIPWKIPEDVVEPVHVANIKVEKKGNNIYVLTGEAINTSKETAVAIDVVVQFYDKSREGISSVAEIADPYEVPPGGKAKYEVQYHVDAHKGEPVYFDIHAIAARFK